MPNDIMMIDDDNHNNIDHLSCSNQSVQLAATTATLLSEASIDLYK
jgi:hypothetical protein